MQKQDDAMPGNPVARRDPSVLAQGFARAYRLERDHDFHDLLAAIDRAERVQQRPS
jgi:hypothetical protein